MQKQRSQGKRGERFRRRSARRQHLFLALGLISACGKLEREPPQIDEVTPNPLWRGAPSIAIIKGRNFYAQADVSLGSTDAVRIRKNFRVLIDSTELSPESITDARPESLTITVPGDLNVGTHAVTVITPEGLSDSLDHAFNVMGSDQPFTPAGGTVNVGGAPATLGGTGSTLGGTGGSGSAMSSGGVAAGGTLSSGGSGGIGNSGGNSNSGGTGGSPPLVNGCVEYDAVSTACIHSCKIVNNTIDYCNMLFYAETADCVFTNQPNPDACGQQTAPGEFQVGKDQPSGGSDARAYLSFNVNRLPPPGHSITDVYLILGATKNALAPSDKSGELWLSEPFTRQDLFTKLPVPLGAAAIGPDLGNVLAFTDVGWSSLTTAFTFPGMAYVVILPNSNNSVYYFNANAADPLNRPYIQVEYR